MDKNDKEKQMMYEWGKKNSDSSQFQGFAANRQSYFMQRGNAEDTNVYIREYGFETLPEFMQELDVLWGDEEVLNQMKKICAVAVMKNEISGYGAKEVPDNSKRKLNREDKLPMHIYNF